MNANVRGDLYSYDRLSPLPYMYYVTASCVADKTKSESLITTIHEHRQYLVLAKYLLYFFLICTRHCNIAKL